MYDVVIIGAGPTGSSAARELADKGYKVLLVEKFKMPRNKSCSGILIRKSIQIIQTYFGIDIPRSVMCNPKDSRGMILTNDDGQEYRYEQNGLNIWRSSFDYWLVQNAMKVGAEFRDGTTVIHCEEQGDCVFITLKGEKEYIEKARMVIACDGAVSSIKRKLICSPRNYIMTYQTFCRGTVELDYHYFYAYLQPRFSEYDAWFNVKDGYLIFGVSVKDVSKIERYYSDFLEYMKREHNAIIEVKEKAEKWIMPCIMSGCPIDYGEGRVIFAGETAGFLNPMGEGISAGLESGYMAAKAIQSVDIHSDFDIRTVHSSYKKYTLDLKNYMERQWRFVAGLSSKFGHMK